MAMGGAIPIMVTISSYILSTSARPCLAFSSSAPILLPPPRPASRLAQHPLDPPPPPDVPLPPTPHHIPPTPLVPPPAGTSKNLTRIPPSTSTSLPSTLGGRLTQTHPQTTQGTRGPRPLLPSLAPAASTTRPRPARLRTSRGGRGGAGSLPPPRRSGLGGCPQ